MFGFSTFWFSVIGTKISIPTFSPRLSSPFFFPSQHLHLHSVYFLCVLAGFFLLSSFLSTPSPYSRFSFFPLLPLSPPLTFPSLLPPLLIFHPHPPSLFSFLFSLSSLLSLSSHCPPPAGARPYLESSFLAAPSFGDSFLASGSILTCRGFQM